MLSFVKQTPIDRNESKIDETKRDNAQEYVM